MNIQEKLKELGYHTIQHGDTFYSTLEVYLHDNLITIFKRKCIQDNWKTIKNKLVTLDNIKEFL